MNWNSSEGTGATGGMPTVSVSISGQGATGRGLQLTNATVHLNGSFGGTSSGRGTQVQGTQGTFRPPVQQLHSYQQQQNSQQQQITLTTRGQISTLPVSQQLGSGGGVRGSGGHPNVSASVSQQQQQQPNQGGQYGEPTLLSLLTCMC